MNDPPHFLPDSAPASPVPDSVSKEENNGTPEHTSSRDLSHLPSEHRDVVRRLMERVEEAVETIEELRAENERLRRRVEELEAEPDYPDDETILALDDDPDEVRERITKFINTIDTYLETTSPSLPEEGIDTDPDA